MEKSKEDLLFEVEKLKDTLNYYNKEMEKIPEKGDVFAEDYEDMFRRIFVYNVEPSRNMVYVLSLSMIKDKPSTICILDCLMDFRTISNFKYIGKTDIDVLNLFLIGK